MDRLHCTEIVYHFLHRKPPIATVVSEMEAAGYTIKSTSLHCFPNIHPPTAFTDKDGPLNPEWRALDRYDYYDYLSLSLYIYIYL